MITKSCLTEQTINVPLGLQFGPTTGEICVQGPSAVLAPNSGLRGAGGGDIQVQGSQVTLTYGSRIEASTLGSKPGGTLAVNASDSVEVIDTLADGLFPSALLAQVYAEASGAGGDLTVKTGRLIVRDEAQVAAATIDQGQAGNLSVSASDSVELIGGIAEGPSGLFTQTQGSGAAGDLRIATGKLLVQDGVA